ncbi:MAG TPA: hypothetical protein VE441_11550 [Mycobacterium sp.]|jgi:hypothetical protein|nr:hypothetical protein [Mycobacterium sp.]
MHDSDTTKPVPARGPTRRVVAAAAVAVVSSAALVAGAPSAARASTPSHPCATTSTSTDWRSAATSANAALSAALENLDNAQYAKAVEHLRIMKRKTRVAKKAATALVGRPPAPESDTPPGVPAVTRVAGLEHHITVTLVPLFRSPAGSHVVRPLNYGLTTAVVCRQRMLAKVIALPAAKRDDYSDNLADTLPDYRKELTAIDGELASEQLSAYSRTALQSTRIVVAATQVAMKKAFGGGE